VLVLRAHFWVFWVTDTRRNHLTNFVLFFYMIKGFFHGFLQRVNERSRRVFDPLIPNKIPVCIRNEELRIFSCTTFRLLIALYS